MSLGEFEMIGRLLAPLSRGYPGALELGDDAAIIDQPEGCQLVVAKDAMVCGVHWLPEDPPETVGGKLLRVNLSDLAAMGADPLAYLLVIARPPAITDAYVERLIGGLAADQDRFRLHLIGGDTVSTSGPLVLSVTVIGSVPRGRALLRRGASPGDLLAVTGSLGAAAQGLRVLQGLACSEEEAVALIDSYRTPQPRLGVGRRLRGLATSCIDVSDGLLADAGHVAERSLVGFRIETDRLPLSAAARALPEALGQALNGGDDYELLFTVPADRWEEVQALAVVEGVPITQIGQATVRRGVEAVDGEGRILEVATPGWQHF